MVGEPDIDKAIDKTFKPVIYNENDGRFYETDEKGFDKSDS